MGREVIWEHPELGVFDENPADSDGYAFAELADLEAGDHSVTLTVTDLDGFYAAATLSFSINATPDAPVVSIAPDSPASEENLSAQIVTESTDPEDELVTYRYEWFNGKTKTGYIDSTVPADATDRDEIWTVRVYPSDGISEGPYGEDSVVVGNAAPIIQTVTIDPSPPSAGDTVTCAYEGFFDTDGDPDNSTFSWALNGKVVGDGNTFPGGHVSGDKITCTVTPNDSFQDGEPVSVTVTVQNTAPVLSSATLLPTTAYEATTLSCTPGTSSDADGDKVTYSYSWSVSGSSIGATSSTLDGTAFDKADSVNCTVTPNDGTDEGTAVTSGSVTILNTAPVMLTASISPTTATETDILTCTGTASDDDGDALTYTYVWSIGGAALKGETSDTLSGDAFNKADVVTCTVTADDGDGGTASLTSSSVTIANSVPVVDVVTLSPDPAYEADTITCTPEAIDDDDDALTYSYSWSVGGIDISPTSETLDGTFFNRDEDVICTVIANDGLDDSVAVSSAALTISNTAPVLTSVTLSPDPAYEADTLTCAAVAADVDGDAYTFAYA